MLGWVGDPNPEDDVVYELYFGVEKDNLSLISTLGPFSSSDRLISYYLDKLESESIYYWQVIAIDSDNSRRISPLWRFSTIDLNAPTLEVTTPISGFMYKNNGTFRKQIPDENNIIIFGSINIMFYLFDNGSGVEKVDIFIDNKLKDTIFEEPYEWYWNSFSLGRHDLRIVAYDYAGNKVEKTFEVMKIF